MSESTHNMLDVPYTREGSSLVLDRPELTQREEEKGIVRQILDRFTKALEKPRG